MCGFGAEALVSEVAVTSLSGGEGSAYCGVGMEKMASKEGVVAEATCGCGGTAIEALEVLEGAGVAAVAAPFGCASVEETLVVLLLLLLLLLLRLCCADAAAGAGSGVKDAVKVKVGEKGVMICWWKDGRFVVTLMSRWASIVLGLSAWARGGEFVVF